MEDQREGDRRAGGADLPERVVTPNMLAGLNMERFRRAAEYTQPELGERLGGWTKTAVSAAERSWDGGKVRQFDANLIARLAAVFGVPAAAFLLPPPDDGERYRYLADTGAGVVPMGEFFAAHFGDAPPGHDGTPAGKAYEEALVAATARYKGPQLAGAPGELGERADAARLEGALRRAFTTSAALYRVEDAMRLLREDNDFLQDLLLAMMRQGAAGRERLEAIDDEHRAASWAGLRGRPEARRQQEHMIALGRELFGDRGPGTSDFRRLIEVARERGLKGPPRTMARLIDGDSELIAPPGGQPAGEEEP